MSKQALQSVIDNESFWAKLRGEEPMDINSLTEAQANKLYDSIDAGMSPENLHCDGEITISQARAKARTYNAAVKELKSMGFAIPKDCYEIS